MTTATWKATVMAGMMIAGACSTIAADRQVLICMDARGFVPGPTQYSAKAQAAAIFAKIGVELMWARPSACGEGGLAIDFIAGAPKDAGALALAHAFPFGNGGQRITVFYGRVKQLIGPQENWGGPVLGHILAHEIGHVLLGTDAHSDSGLMKAQWTRQEVSMMRFYPLGFTPLHAQMIRERLDRGVLSASAHMRLP